MSSISRLFIVAAVIVVVACLARVSSASCQGDISRNVTLCIEPLPVTPAGSIPVKYYILSQIRLAFVADGFHCGINQFASVLSTAGVLLSTEDITTLQCHLRDTLRYDVLDCPKDHIPISYRHTNSTCTHIDTFDCARNQIATPLDLGWSSEVNETLRGVICLPEDQDVDPEPVRNHLGPQLVGNGDAYLVGSTNLVESNFTIPVPANHTLIGSHFVMEYVSLEIYKQYIPDELDSVPWLPLIQSADIFNQSSAEATEEDLSGIDDCDPNPCSENTTCYDMVGGYACYNETCDVDPCNDIGSSSCAIVNDTVSCVCDDGYSGEFCQTVASCAAATACESTDVCYTGVDGLFVCALNSTEREPCRTNPCLNGGSCTALLSENTFRCDCLTENGNFGDLCEKTFALTDERLPTVPLQTNQAVTSTMSNAQCTAINETENIWFCPISFPAHHICRWLGIKTQAPVYQFNSSRELDTAATHQAYDSIDCRAYMVRIRPFVVVQSLTTSLSRHLLAATDSDDVNPFVQTLEISDQIAFVVDQNCTSWETCCWDKHGDPCNGERPLGDAVHVLYIVPLAIILVSYVAFAVIKL